ncbi:hypothetical protein DYB38_009604, partial [Aphanomyces astaci]
MLPVPGDDAPSNGKGKRIAIIAVAVVLVAGGVTAAIVLSSGSGSGSDTNSSSGNKGGSTTVAPANIVTAEDLLGTSKPPAGATTTPAPTPASDPETGKAALTMLAIGDWGSTTGKKSGSTLDDAGDPGSCCKKFGGSGPNANKVDTSRPRIKVDYWSQLYVSTILAQSAGELKPKPARVIGHGDNIYWNGAAPGDIAYRMEETFEKKYAQPALAGIKWVNVAGNHDIGGSDFICGEKDYNFYECKDTAEMLKYLDLKFDLQAQYKSPNQDRWLMKDHYYVESVKSED